MHQIKTKLKSGRGASIIMSMVFFLLCVSLGAIMLTAATASSGTLLDHRAVQQRYFTVSSAERLLRAQIEGVSFSAVTVTVDGADEGTDYSASSSALEETLKADAAYVFENGRAPSARSITVSVPGFEAVQALFQMGGDYSVSIRLSTSDAAGGEQNPLLLHLAGSGKTTRDSYSWTESVPATDADGNPTTELISHRRVTETFSVTWGGGYTEKGVTP